MTTTICAWCGKVIDSPKNDTSEKKLVSHGICESCRERIFNRKIGNPLEFIERIEYPVFVVDTDGRILTANKKAVKITRQDIKKVVGGLGGDVFNCVYSGLPGGCGYTPHCSGCLVRKAVAETFESGLPKINLPVSLTRNIAGKEETQIFYITTEKTNGIVLLRIDSFAKTDSKI